jgi:hypothetical protein
MRMDPVKTGPQLVAEAKAACDARAAAEAARIEAVKATGAAPAACGPDLPLAPARGPLTTFTPMRLVPGHVGLAEHTGHWERGEGARRKGARRADVFDRIEAAAREAHRRKGERAGPFLPPLSPAQVQIGRDYRDLMERRSAGGVRCASLEALGRGSGGQGGEFIDAYAAEGQKIAAMLRRVGTGAALTVRRIRPARRGTRGIITDRRLVDMVCIEDKDLGQVLEAHGWAAFGATREALRKALAAVLDRMIGYRV